MDGWGHAQKVDYEQLPFKCKKFHEYGYFVKNWPKEVQENLEKTLDERWEKEKKGRKTALSNPKSKDPQLEKGKESEQGEKEVTKK